MSAFRRCGAWLAAAALGAAASSVAGTAEASEPRLSIQWERLADVLQSGTQALARGQAPVLVRPESTSGEDERFVDMAPRLTLVARDWSGAQLVSGRLALTDQIRLIRSSRMVLSRLRLGSGRLAPFAQVGVGQWRIDGDLLPGMPHDMETAAQLGAGFELKVRPRAVIAVEVDDTVLCPLDGHPQIVPDTHLWAASLVARAVF